MICQEKNVPQTVSRLVWCVLDISLFKTPIASLIISGETKGRLLQLRAVRDLSV